MQKSIILFSAVLFLLALLGGCATMADVVKAKDEGTSKVYPVTSDQAWMIAKTVFRWEGSDAIEEHKDEGYMLTSSGMNLVSYGAVMGAWIEPVDRNNTKVTVVTKRRIATNLATTLTESTFHKRFAQAVEIVKTGKTLPSQPPQ
jgi:PBP1b-binding outer membrane lipoprotein LpoB